jgi:hypothetical protein
MTSNVTITTGIGYAQTQQQLSAQQLPAYTPSYVQQAVYYPNGVIGPLPAGYPIQVGQWSAGPVNIAPASPTKNTEFSLEELELAETIMEECDAARAP